MALPSITLRPLEASDADDFLVLAGDDRVTQFTNWNTFTTREEALGYLKEVVTPHPWYKAICIEDCLVGVIAFKPKAECRGEIGYVLASAYWRRGIATASIKMTISIVFGEFPKLERVEAVVDVENKGSQRVLEKLGFHREAVLRKFVFIKGRARDCVMYSLLSTDSMV